MRTKEGAYRPVEAGEEGVGLGGSKEPAGLEDNEGQLEEPETAEDRPGLKSRSCHSTTSSLPS
eukprot:15448154-Alexandrium_andersonii.AAC.1